MTWIRTILEISYNLFPIAITILYFMQGRDIKNIQKSSDIQKEEMQNIKKELEELKSLKENKEG